LYRLETQRQSAWSAEQLRISVELWLAHRDRLRLDLQCPCAAGTDAKRGFVAEGRASACRVDTVLLSAVEKPVPCV
jgi:hypothetical protein